ncbi:MAG: hypothetical protein ACXVGB_00090 [Mycobacteriaceae bacterium]
MSDDPKVYTQVEVDALTSDAYDDGWADGYDAGYDAASYDSDD